MKSSYYALLLFIFVVASCKDKNPEADCGCDSPTIKIIENVKASYVGSNGLLLRLKSPDDAEYEELYQLCSKTDSLTITPDIKNPNYTVSGKVKKSCFLGPRLTIQAQLFEATEIKKTL
ncbi:hypothetical protein [Dyadobacter alkalitolerans]|uniref:hypothetical protein n=1 Tax=Dyadobacter alkalitolerans TaxID=492736 RepID=UPI00047A0F02|nr:hypothetical protein [Dyadobacter alkalitolerans]